ncbi:DUF300-domain-containing protein [Atractiella rhizophila]|nr:DUF300-domain-containing protein [Atractiella rhizophila]
MIYHVRDVPESDGGGGSGEHLPPLILTLSTFSSLFATILSIYTIWLQLKNYRKVMLQRFVVRILVMVPIYALSSLISLYSLDIAFYLDAIRDVYEAFVIYCFFTLLVEYLGGERSLLLLLHSRPPIRHPWPISICLPPMDASDPYTFLALKRGILQYVHLKPVLAAVTMILKATGTYQDGNFTANSGYTYVSIVYNFSVCLSLYCLGMFWAATNSDLRPFRPVPKFLCVKGIIFFSFWQGLFISLLVAAGIVTSPNHTSETLGLAATDTLMCFEMPFFAVLHLYAFSHTDYIPQNALYSGRLPFSFALRDSLLGYKDVLNDSITALKGTGFSYRTFEPVEGGVHVGPGRERRIRAGLRYAEGGTKKYWMPMPGGGDGVGTSKRRWLSKVIGRPVTGLTDTMAERERQRGGYAPLSQEQEQEVWHRDPNDRRRRVGEGMNGITTDLVGDLDERERDSDEETEESLEFEGVDEEEEETYRSSRALEFGDYNYPCVDASKEEARRKMFEDEERAIYGEQIGSSRMPQESFAPSWLSKDHRLRKDVNNGKRENSSYGRLADASSVEEVETEPGKFVIDEEVEADLDDATKPKKDKAEDELPEDCVDILVEDQEAEDDEMVRERLKGEPTFRSRKKIFRRKYIPDFSPSNSPSTSVPGTPDDIADRRGSGGDSIREGQRPSHSLLPAKLTDPKDATKAEEVVRRGKGKDVLAQGDKLTREVERPEWTKVVTPEDDTDNPWR